MSMFNWLRPRSPESPPAMPVFDPIQFLNAFRTDYEIGLTAAGHLAVRRQGHWRSLDARHGELSRWLWKHCARRNQMELFDQALVDRCELLLKVSCPELPKETLVK